MQLKNYRECPPNYYRYVSPVTGTTIQEMNVGAWVAEAKRDLERNGHEVPQDLQQQMEDQLCSTLPPGWCDFDDPLRPRVNTEFTWSDVETGSKTLFEWAKQGLPLVDQDEAERRAKICANCYMNVRAVGCGQSCIELIRSIVGWFVGRKTSVDDRLQSCAVCHCFLKSKVHAPLAVIEKYDNDSLQVKFPQFCWLKRSSDNYKP